MKNGLISIEESGMNFGEYKPENIFHMEESSIYKNLRCGKETIRTVEFVLRHKNRKILMIEAKSSSPRPGNKEDFDGYIYDISSKFEHSVDLYFSLVLKRLSDSNGEMPEYFKSADYSDTEIILLLIINGHKEEWLIPVSDALKKKLKRLRKTWNLEVVVMNDRGAVNYGLLSKVI